MLQYCFASYIDNNFITFPYQLKKLELRFEGIKSLLTRLVVLSIFSLVV